MDSKEHKHISNKASERKNVNKITLKDGFKVTFGAIAAMAGDYVESGDDILNLSFDEFEHINKFKIDGVNPPSNMIAGKQKRFNNLEKKVTQRFFDLLGKNSSHFSNPHGNEDSFLLRVASGTENNARAYHESHKKALELAVESGKLHENKKQSKAIMNRALAFEAFSSHFLVDAFAAGHIRYPRTSIKKHWEKRVPMFWYNFLWWFAESIVKELRNLRKLPIFIDKASNQIIWEQALKTLENKPIPPLSFGDLISGAVHDEDNAEGIKAQVGEQQIILFGDGKVFQGQETKTSIAAINACAESIDEVLDAFKKGKEEKTTQEALEELKVDGLFKVEAKWPKALPESQQDENKRKIEWELEINEALTENKGSRLRTAINGFMVGRAEEIQKEIDKISDEHQRKAASKVIAQLSTNNVQKVVKLLSSIIDYTLEDVIAINAFTDDDRDNNALAYYQRIEKTSKEFNFSIEQVLKTLSIRQKEKLINSVIGGFVSPSEEEMIVDLLKSNIEHSIKIIDSISWRTFWDNLEKDRYKNFVESFCGVYWKTKTLADKKNEISFLAQGFTGELAQQTIVLILETCQQPKEVVEIDKEVGGVFGLAFDLEGKWKKRFLEMKKENIS